MVNYKRSTDGRYTNVYGPTLSGCLFACFVASAIGSLVVYGLLRAFQGNLTGWRLVTVGAVALFFVWVLAAIVDETFAPIWRLWGLGAIVAIGLGYQFGWIATIIVLAALIILQALLSLWWAISDRLASIETKISENSQNVS